MINKELVFNVPIHYPEDPINLSSGVFENTNEQALSHKGSLLVVI